MDKSFGEKHFKYTQFKKQKKNKYSDHRNKSPLHKPLRNFVNSYINKNKHNVYDLEDFIFPIYLSNTYNYYDCTPPKPKVF